MLRFSLVQRTDSDRNETVTTVILGCFLVLTLSACDGRTPPLETVDAIVYGTVTTASGASVDGATVTLTHHPDGCDSRDVDMDLGVTDSTGSFRVGLPILYGETKNSCFLASVDPSDGSGLDTPEPKQFDADFRSDPPYDSVRVDFVLDSLSTN